MADVTRPRQRGNGDGTTWLAKDKPRRKPWAAVLVVGWTPEGRAIKRTRFASSEREAKMLLAEMRRAHAGGRPLPSDRLTVGRWLVDWLAHVRPTLRPGTVRAYEGTIRRDLLPDLGTLPLRTLSPSRVETMLARMAERGLSANTQASARDVLRRALADAVKDGHVDRNVAALARPPRQSREQLPAPTTADVRALLAALDGHRLREMVLVMAATGLRVSEAMGLRWKDVTDEAVRGRTGGPLAAENDRAVDNRPSGTSDNPLSEAPADRVRAPVGGMARPMGSRVREADVPSAGSTPAALTVRYQLARIDGEPVLAEPKSARSRRTILLPPLAAAALRRHGAIQAAERLAAGTKWRDATGLVFTAKDGAPLSESTLQWVMARACRAAGIRHMSPHDLRRWTATAIVATGDVKAAQAVLGHVSASLTTDTYASATDAGLRHAADAIEGALG